MVRKTLSGLFLIATLLCAAGEAAYAQADPVTVSVKDKGGAYDVVADNAYSIPAWVVLSFPTLTGFKASENLPAGRLVPALSQGVVILTLEAIPEAKRRSYKMTVAYAKGDPATAKPDENFLYVFPFAHGTKHRVTQGYNGNFFAHC